MKRNYLILTTISFVLSLAITGCKNPYEYVNPEITEISVEASRNSAIFRAKVNFMGEKLMKLDLSTNADLSNARHYEMLEDGDYGLVVEVNQLTALTDYYYRIEGGNANFTLTSEVKQFTTLDVPIVATNEVSSITWTTARGGGWVSEDYGAEVTDCGICWSTSHNPNLNNNHASGGSGMGNFSVDMTNLTENTTYYVRAYATSKAGTGYGNEVSFTTESTTKTFRANGVSFSVKLVEGGSFQMGCDESGAMSDEKPVHSVTVSTFFIGETHVTQELWKAVMGSNPSSFSGLSRPVETVSWNTVVNEFLPKLNAATGHVFRLPTEAEWEYAARGGRYSHGYKFAGSNDINAVGWYDSNSGGETHNVKQKLPNELGLYDMTGNVLDWCQDWYGSYSSNFQTNPQGPSSGSKRVTRGGSCFGTANYCRVSVRIDWSPNEPMRGIGFRVVLVR